MRHITPEQLQEILNKHRMWLRSEEGGERADLSEADLSEADLRDANLRDANLTAAILTDANLREAYLSRADLRDANLRGADLREADLTVAILTGANLSGAILSGASLWKADLRKANLSSTELTGAILTGANLSGARINWNSHDLMAELMSRHAGNDREKRKVAGLPLVSRDWCWARFQKECRNDPLWGWAIKTLRQYVTEGDDAPDILKEAGL